MTRWNGALLSVVLSGCAVVVPVAAAPQVALIIVNGSDESVIWIVEQPSGRIDRLPMQACSSHSKLMDPGHAWRVEVAGDVVVSSDEVAVIAAPVSVVRVDVAPDGRVQISGPSAADQRPDAPIRFSCA